MAIINGRRIDPNEIPDAGVYGEQIIRSAKPSEGRRIVIEKGTTQFETIDPRRRYSKSDLLDKKGRSVKIADIPDRTKGNQL